MAQKIPSISVFFPCYNDEKTIGKLVEDAFDTLKTLTNDYEVIVVDDESKDNSREVLSKLAKQHKDLKLIFHEQNKGYGGALQSGFKNAAKDLVFYTDGDGQYDVKELPILYSLMTDDVDFVNGIKMSRNDPTYRIVVGNLYSLVIRWTFWIPIADVDCDFRLIRQKIVQKMHLTVTSGAICVELVKQAKRAGARFKQVSVHHYERKHGSSQFFRPEKILHTFWELANLWIKLVLTKRWR
jgi:glycosyltransferase involved in cell wall biosynthesis